MVGSGIITVLTFFLIAAGILVLGLVTSWIDRKVTALVQARVGPPWFQPVADILKLLGKETLVPEGSGRTVFLSAPLFGFAGIILAAGLLGHVLLMPGKGFLGDIKVTIKPLIDRPA